MNKMSGLSLDLEKENIDKLKELFPAAVEEGKINFDMLRSLLGDEVDDSREKYQFTWNGKAKSIKLAQTPSSATLRPCKEKSKNWDTTENLYIEGDNLEVLKQLQKTYYKKVGLIYIDPPYNTGHDFIYKDSRVDSIANYFEQTSQGMQSNPETDGRYHTKWLNMLYPRLVLAKNLLSEDGIIAVSIDDYELNNLTKICDEIFGEINRINTIVWQRNSSGKTVTKQMPVNCEYVLLYGKSQNYLMNPVYKPLSEATIKMYSKDDNDGRGKYRLYPMQKTSTPGPETTYDYVDNNGKIWKCPAKGWRMKKEKIKALENEGRLCLENDTLSEKAYWNEREVQGKISDSLWDDIPDYVINDLNDIKNTRMLNIQENSAASKELSKLFQGQNLFDNPKPINLIQRFLNMKNEDCLVLDFFSGSATTAHAIMKQNAEDGGNRKFIMVQLDEPCNSDSNAYKAGYNSICEIGEERIRRAGEQIKADWEKEHPSDTLFSSDEEFTTDIGFKVFKLDSSNVNEWDSSLELDEKELAERLGEVFKTDRSKEDILYEIMLKYGVFDRQVEDIEVNGKTMYRVGKRYMIVCLEDNIDSNDIKAIGELAPKTVIFKESGFTDDNAKLNAVYNLEKAGVEDVKCI